MIEFMTPPLADTQRAKVKMTKTSRVAEIKMTKTAQNPIFYSKCLKLHNIILNAIVINTTIKLFTYDTPTTQVLDA